MVVQPDHRLRWKVFEPYPETAAGTMPYSQTLCRDTVEALGRRLAVGINGLSMYMAIQGNQSLPTAS